MAYNHGEAFCLMKYRGEKSGRIEWLWNSRDGVTPFMIGGTVIIGGQREMMQHVDWPEDARVPNYIPPIGSRVFMDHDEASAALSLKRREEITGMTIPAESRAAVLADILRGPRVEEVDEHLQRMFRKRAEGRT